jgi:hypothetical protein
MALDNIIIFVLAIGFFGGIIFLALKSRRDTTSEGHPSSSPAQNSADDVALPSQPREKERRKSKS